MAGDACGRRRRSGHGRDCCRRRDRRRRSPCDPRGAKNGIRPRRAPRGPDRRPWASGRRRGGHLRPRPPLRRSAAEIALAGAVRKAAAGDGTLPSDLLGRLLEQVGRLQRQVLAPSGLSFNGLSKREVEVLRLVAEGLDTSEIARRSRLLRADDQERDPRRHDAVPAPEPLPGRRLRAARRSDLVSSAHGAQPA